MHNLVAEQKRFCTDPDYKELSAQSSRAVRISTQQRLIFVAKEMHSLRSRSKSLTERLHNEINLVCTHPVLTSDTQQQLTSAGIQPRDTI